MENRRHHEGERLIPFVYTNTVDLYGQENNKQNIRALSYINPREARTLLGILEQPRENRLALGKMLADALDDLRAAGKLGPDCGIPIYLKKGNLVLEVSRPIYWRVLAVLMYFLAEQTEHVVETARSQLSAFIAGQDIRAINPYASIAYQKTIKADKQGEVSPIS